MILESEIRSVVERKMHQIGGFLVDVKVSHTNDITVLIDLDNGVTLDHCTNITKHIESYFDRETEDYSLMKMALRLISQIPSIRTVPSPGQGHLFSFLVGLTAAKILAGKNMMIDIEK